jgi:uncharacterized protein YlxW (UPF0749 family)
MRLHEQKTTNPTLSEKIATYEEDIKKLNNKKSQLKKEISFLKTSEAWNSARQWLCTFAPTTQSLAELKVSNIIAESVLDEVFDHHIDDHHSGVEIDDHHSEIGHHTDGNHHTEGDHNEIDHHHSDHSHAGLQFIVVCALMTTWKWSGASAFLQKKLSEWVGEVKECKRESRNLKQQLNDKQQQYTQLLQDIEDLKEQKEQLSLVLTAYHADHPASISSISSTSSSSASSSSSSSSLLSHSVTPDKNESAPILEKATTSDPLRLLGASRRRNTSETGGIQKTASFS